MLQYFAAGALSIGNNNAIVQQIRRGYNVRIYLSILSSISFLILASLTGEGNAIYECKIHLVVDHSVLELISVLIVGN